MGNSTPIRESATLMLGVRDLDPAEEERLGHSDIQVVKWLNGKPQSDVRIAIDRLSKHVREIYLHIDMDSLDPECAPGVGLLQGFDGLMALAPIYFRVEPIDRCPKA